MPTLREFLDNKNLEEKVKVFGMSHEFDKDPRAYCPQCDSKCLDNLTPRHTIDYNEYQCKKCHFRYGLDYDDVGH